MSGSSSIEWTDATWNPVRGCSRVSEGCRNCYAERLAARFIDNGGWSEGYASRTAAGPRWTGKVELVPSALDWPLRKRKPLRIFVNSMSDLFHERLSDEEIAAVFGVMAACPQHTFQVLTKRPERARKWFEWLHNTQTLFGFERVRYCAKVAHNKLHEVTINRDLLRLWDGSEVPPSWPLPNVWLGVSVEDQATADERIPLLLECPAAVRFCSYEPALGAVDFTRWLRLATMRHVAMSVEGAIRNRAYDCLQTDTGKPMTRREAENELLALHARGVKLVPAGDCEGFDPQSGCPGHRQPRADWLIVGGESGPGARPFDLAWARAVVEQCREAGVACFVKQLGARPYDSEYRAGVFAEHDRRTPTKPDGAGGTMASGNLILLRDRKGGDWSEWPSDLKVREFPR